MCIISSSRGAPPPRAPPRCAAVALHPRGGQAPCDPPRPRAAHALLVRSPHFRGASTLRRPCGTCGGSRAQTCLRAYLHCEKMANIAQSKSPLPVPPWGEAPPSGISCAKRGKKCENKVCNKQSNTATPAPTVAVVRRGARAPTGAYSLELFAQARSTAAMAIVASLIKRKFYIIAGKKRPPQLRKSGRLFPQLARCGLFCALSFRALGTVQRTTVLAV